MTTGPFTGLSVNDCHILLEIARGRTNAQISQVLPLAPGTIRNHISEMMAVLKCDNRAALAAYAIRNGLPSLRFWEADPNARMYADIAEHLKGV